MEPDEITEKGGLDPEVQEGRVLAALSYVFFLCFLAPVSGAKNKFALHHARQGTVLFLVEVVVFIAVAILSHTIGLVPVLGFLVMVPIKLVLYVGLLIAALGGFIKSISGEYWEMPVLGEYARKVPF